MNYFKGNGMGFVNRKQNQTIVKSSRKSLKPKEVEGMGVIAGDQINNAESFYNELYRYHD